MCIRDRAYEGRLVTRPIEESMLEPSWKPSGDVYKRQVYNSLNTEDYDSFFKYVDSRLARAMTVSYTHLDVYKRQNYCNYTLFF